MAIIARQFGRPHGPLGILTGTVMARANAGFGRWVIQQIAGHYRGSPGRLAELGPGPGIALQEALRMFPQAACGGSIPPRSCCPSPGSAIGPRCGPGGSP